MKNIRLLGVGLALAATVGTVTAATATANGGADHGSATIVDSTGATIGFAKFVEDGPGTVHVNVKAAGLTPGLHGVHLHENGSCDSGTGPFSGAGSHHRAAGSAHPDHWGDLPNLVVNAAGRGHLDATTERTQLTAGDTTIFDANGSAIVIHALEDQFDAVNFGGGRVACGVIEPD
jgi:Cu-Zn family superoxide dismutase